MIAGLVSIVALGMGAALMAVPGWRIFLLEVIGLVGGSAFVGAYLGVRYGLSQHMPAELPSSVPFHRGRTIPVEP